MDQTRCIESSVEVKDDKGLRYKSIVQACHPMVLEWTKNPHAELELRIGKISQNGKFVPGIPADEMKLLANKLSKCAPQTKQVATDLYWEKHGLRGRLQPGQSSGAPVMIQRKLLGRVTFLTSTHYAIRIAVKEERPDTTNTFELPPPTLIRCKRIQITPYSDEAGAFQYDLSAVQEGKTLDEARSTKHPTNEPEIEVARQNLLMPNFKQDIVLDSLIAKGLQLCSSPLYDGAGVRPTHILSS